MARLALVDQKGIGVDEPRINAYRVGHRCLTTFAVDAAHSYAKPRCTAAQRLSLSMRRSRNETLKM